jgi:hypothetical protein
VILKSSHDALNFKYLNFYENEKIILEVFFDRVRFVEYDINEKQYNTFNSLVFEESSHFKCFDTASNIFLFGLVSGYVVYVVVHPAGYSMLSFKLSKFEVTFCKIIVHDGAVIVGDRSGNNYYIKLIPQEKNGGSNQNQSLKSQFTFEAFYINVGDSNVEIKSYLTHCIFDVVEPSESKATSGPSPRSGWPNLNNEDIA